MQKKAPRGSLICVYGYKDLDLLLDNVWKIYFVYFFKGDLLWQFRVQQVII